jgi:hypothetical protein
MMMNIQEILRLKRCKKADMLKSGKCVSGSTVLCCARTSVVWQRSLPDSLEETPHTRHPMRVQDVTAAAAAAAEAEAANSSEQQRDRSDRDHVVRADAEQRYRANAWGTKVAKSLGTTLGGTGVGDRTASTLPPRVLSSVACSPVGVRHPKGDNLREFVRCVETAERVTEKRSRCTWVVMKVFFSPSPPTNKMRTHKSSKSFSHTTGHTLLLHRPQTRCAHTNPASLSATPLGHTLRRLLARHCAVTG